MLAHARKPRLKPWDPVPVDSSHWAKLKGQGDEHTVSAQRVERYGVGMVDSRRLKLLTDQNTNYQQDTLASNELKRQFPHQDSEDPGQEHRSAAQAETGQSLRE